MLKDEELIKSLLEDLGENGRFREDGNEFLVEFETRYANIDYSYAKEMLESLLKFVRAMQNKDLQEQVRELDVENKALKVIVGEMETEDLPEVLKDKVEDKIEKIIEQNN